MKSYQNPVLLAAANLEISATIHKLNTLIEEDHPDDAVLSIAAIKTIVDMMLETCPAEHKARLERVLQEMAAAKDDAQAMLTAAMTTPGPAKPPPRARKKAKETKPASPPEALNDTIAALKKGDVIKRVVKNAIADKMWRSEAEKNALGYLAADERSRKNDVIAYVRAEYEKAGAGWNGRFQGGDS